jgi:EpsI family protein
MIQRLLALVGVLVVGAIAIHAASDVDAVPIRRPLMSMPEVIGAWQNAGEIEIDQDTLNVLRADDYVNRRYVQGGVLADLFIAYYASQRQGGTMHSPMNCLPASGWQPLSRDRINIPAGDGGAITSNRYVIQKGLDQQLVFYWYQSHGRTIASEYTSKIYLVLDSLRLHRSDAALVRVVVPILGAATEAQTAATSFVTSLSPFLEDYIPK